MQHFRKKSSSSSPIAPTTPTNSPQSPPSPVIEYIKKELTSFYPRIKDQRVLAASSSAIALSIASPACNPADLPVSSKGSAWKTAYGVARMAVEAANSTSDVVFPLKAVAGALSVLINNYDKTTANSEQIGEIEDRIQSLCVILGHPVDDQDHEEKARRETLRRRLRGIVAGLRPLSEQHGLLKFFKNVDNADSLKNFIQDLAYAVTDYQTSIQQNTYKNTRNIIEAADLELLEKLGPVHDAGYQAGHHDTCLRGTREVVLKDIMRWAKDPQDRHVFWLNGLAGTGKSTIAQTFTEMTAEARILGASFFCSRDYLDRKELKNIFPTLAYQLACQYPTFRSEVIRAVKKDPSVARNSLISQLKTLIVDPLSSTNISCVVVVDALDECIDDQPASAILSVLGRYAKQMPSIKFFITGRPEPRIRTGFRLPLLEPLTQVFLLHEVELSSVNEDIRWYLQEKLSAAVKQRSDFDLPNPWPCAADLTTLTKKSSGLFIFASTLVRFIESEHHLPNERLQLIVTSSESTIHEGRAGIDPLYIQVFRHAFTDVKEPTIFANLRRVLGAVVLAFNPLSRAQIAKILCVETSLISTTLRHLHSVLLVPNEDSKEIRIFHKSFPDFLQDRDRCSDLRFFIDPLAHHRDIALDCLELLKKLKPNPCRLPYFSMNRDALDLPKRLEDYVGSATRYACNYWAMHFRSSPTTNDDAAKLIISATEFFESSAITWIEIMSLENRLEVVIHSIYNLLDWISMVDISTSDLRLLAQDFLRFTMHFFRPIQQSALHTYHCALSLSPMLSKLRPMIIEEKTRILGSTGLPRTWGTVMRTIKDSPGGLTYMTTFGHRIAACYDGGTVAIYDSVTGVLRLSLTPVHPVQAMAGSPDGSMLFCTHKEPLITSWDIQTGGLVHTFVFKQDVESVAISPKGRYLACTPAGSAVKVVEITNQMEVATVGSGSRVTCLCWLDPEERLATAEGNLVYIWDVVSGNLLRTLKTLDPIDDVVYSQKLDNLAVVGGSGTGSTITTINPQTGVCSPLRRTTQKLSFLAFSRTTKEFVCGMKMGGAELSNASTQGWRYLKYPDTMSFLSILPNGTMVASTVDSGIQLLSLDEGLVPSRPEISALTVHPFDEGRIIAVLSATHSHIIILGSSLMTQRLEIPTQDQDPVILCASLGTSRVVCCFWNGNRGSLQLWMFGQKTFKNAIEIDELPSAGGISPSGKRIVTLHILDSQARICVWTVDDGQLYTQLLVERSRAIHPLEIKFQSEDLFHIQYDASRIPYRISHQVLCEKPETQYSGWWCKRKYDVDNSREWVVDCSGGTRRICWIPPGYIGSGQASYCWSEGTLHMVGQDGALRGITFRMW